MSLHGNLKELRLGDVLQALLTADHHGCLRVRRGGDRAVIEIARSGLRLLEPEVLDERMIVEALVERGSLAKEIAERALAQEGSPLATVLASGAVPATEVNALVGNAAEDRVLDVLAWPDGEFRFEEGAAFDPPKGPVAAAVLEPSGLLLRAAQRLDETRQITERLGASALYLIPVPDAKTPADLPSPEATRLASRLDGRMLLDEIALKDGLSLFQVRKAALELIDAGFARVPSAPELAERAAEREKAGDVRAALGCLKQWQAAHPLDSEPFALAAALCAKANRFEDESDSLKALGRVRLKVAQPKEARLVFEKVLQKRPGDPDALEGLRQSAKALGDEATFSDATRKLAQDALDAGDATQASVYAQEVLVSQPGDVEARIVKTRALIHLGEKGQAVEEIERIAGLLPEPCRKKADRVAATWCRDAIAQMAPDRSDLLRSLRERSEPPASTKKRVAILAGLLVVCAVMGVILWPNPAGGLLARARSAYDSGDLAGATTIIGELAEKYPDGKECDEALELKRKIETATASRPKAPDSKAVKELRERIEKTAAALPKVPDALATAELDALVVALRAPEAVPLRGETIERLRFTFPEALGALRRSALERRDALDLAASASQRLPANLPRFEEIVEKARAALDPAWGPLAAKASQALRRLGDAVGESAFGPAASEDLRCLEQDVRLAVADAGLRGPDVDRARRELHRMRLTAAYEAARIEAASALVHGDLDAAERDYAALGDLVDAIDGDPVLRPLKDLVDRRGILEYSHSKTEMVRTIRKGLDAATAAEGAGNLKAAAAAYATLVDQFPLVQFDKVFTVPVRVSSTPPGAKVAVNGHEVGPSPVVVRYAWGSQAVVTVAADGYEVGSVALRTADPQPEVEIQVALTPRIRWVRPLNGIVEATPLGIDGDAILCTRAGRIERRAKDTGEVRWAAETRSVEGVRGRPALLKGTLWVPLVDGQIARVSADGGVLLDSLRLPGRSVGDAATQEGQVAFATESSLVLFGAQGAPATIASGTSVTAGVVGAFGAFWVGDADGSVVCVNAKTREVVKVRLGGSGPVVGLAAGEKNVFAATEDGLLVCLDGSAPSHEILWKRTGVGDLVGAPAEAMSAVAVSDRSGVVRFFSSRDGSPKGEQATGSPLRGSLAAVNDRIAAALADGRLWVYAPAVSAAIVDVSLQGQGRMPAADLGDGTVLVPAADGTVTAIRIPR